MTNEELVERNAKVVKELTDLVNIMGNEEDLAKVFVSQLNKTHPTLQQNLFRVFASVIKEHAARPYTDLRNEGSVEWAKKVVEATKKTYMPFI